MVAKIWEEAQVESGEGRPITVPILKINMKIETSNNGIRVPFHSGESFVDIKWIDDYEHNALMIQSLTPFCFWAVIKLVGEDIYDPYRIVAFPHKGWFDEWFEIQKVKPKVIFSQGISK